MKGKRKLDLSHIDLRKLDLTRKYDDDFGPADGIAWRDHVLLYTLASLVFIFILWASFAKVEEVTRGEARVIPSSEVQVIQTLEGGIIDEFLVREGDTVEKDQIILRLRDVQARSDYSSNMQKYLGLLATVTRLQAEADGKSPVFSDEMKKGAPESVEAEQAAFAANRRQYDNQMSVLKQQLSQKEQEVQELSRRISDVSGLIQIAQDERNMVAPAVERGAAPRMQLLQLDRQIAERQAELNGLRLALPRSRSAVQEVSARIKEQESSFRAEAQRQLSDRTTELNALKETLSAFADRSDRMEIRSPMRGTVKAMRIKTVGGVAKPGEPIMEIVPLEDTMVVEARVSPADIAFIYPGQRAVVRLTAYDFSIYGALEGEVADISADTLTNDKGESFYRVRVITKESSLKKGGKELKVIPGMVATVDIITGEKTIMRYLLKPFVRAAGTALRER